MTMEFSMRGGLDARGKTRLKVLQCIHTAGEISRTDIAKRLESSPATVTSACVALLEMGMIREVECAPTGTAQRGRPKVMLQINGDAFLVAGLKVLRHSILVMIVDFRGKELGTYSSPLTAPQLPANQLVLEVREALEKACEALQVPIKDVAAVAMGLPGFVNGETGFMHWSSSVAERNVDFVPLLAKHLPCPTFLDNDANLVAKAEHLFGAGRGLSNFLVVTIEHGVGLGIVLGEKLYRGERGCGAEFGHIKLQIDGALCQCGQRGCLEAYVGDYAMVRDASTGRQIGAPTTIMEIFEAAQQGDELSQHVLERAFKILGVAIANLVNIFDPQLIVLCRSRPDFGLHYPELMLESLRSNTVQIDAPLPAITVRNLNETMWAKGAAAHGIEMLSILKIRDLGKADTA